VVDKSVRRGVASLREIYQVREAYGESTAQSLAEWLHAAGVRLVEDSCLTINRQTNVLMSDLTLPELVFLCLQLPVVPKTPHRLYEHVLKRGCRELNLKRLDYIDSDEQWYYLAPSFNSLQRIIRSLFDSGTIPFARDWQAEDKRTDLRALRGWMQHPDFSTKVLPAIRHHYVALRAVQLLMSWIALTGKLNPSMTEIIEAGLQHDGVQTMHRLLLSDRPSESESALRQRKDICYDCPPRRRCYALKGADDPYVVLSMYRHRTLETVVCSLHPRETLAECLVSDHLIEKFFVPYSLVVSTKRFMIDIGLLDVQSGVYPKNSGKYCPREDRWLLAHLEGPEPCHHPC
jgi:hypothetical protein